MVLYWVNISLFQVYMYIKDIFHIDLFLQCIYGLSEISLVSYQTQTQKSFTQTKEYIGYLSLSLSYQCEDVRSAFLNNDIMKAVIYHHCIIIYFQSVWGWLCGWRVSPSCGRSWV